MARNENQHVVLMAIKPRYSQRILAGDKKVEFRKTAFRHAVSHVVIYESGSTGKIVGFFVVDGVEQATPKELWQRFAAVGGVSEKEFMDYFGPLGHGTAIRIGAVTTLEQPLSISELSTSYRPPQSFSYISADEFVTLLQSNGT